MSRKNPVFSDDPNAVPKLQAELEKCEKVGAIMKQANAIVRRDRKAGTRAGIPELEALGIKRAERLYEPDFCGRYGFADFELTNNNANIRRLKARIATLTAVPA